MTRTRAADDFPTIRARMEELRPMARPRAADDFATIRARMEELRRESLLLDLKQRIRDIRQGPDGLIYLLTEEVDGAVLKIEPAD